MNLSVSLACRKLTSLFTATSTSLLLTLVMSGIFANAQTASTSTSVTATSSSGDWTQFLNNSMQRWNPYENILGVNNAGSLQLKWTQTTTGAFYSDPVVANGVVYVSGGDARLYAFNASTGEVLWSYNAAGFAVIPQPAVANGMVYFDAFDGNVYALNASTGAKLWSYNTGSANIPGGEITVANGTVYASMESTEGPPGSIGLYALDADTGALLWTSIGGSVPAVANGVVYLSPSGYHAASQIVALSASTGATLWDYYINTSGVGSSSPVVADGMVFFGGVGDDNIAREYAVNASTGKTLWVYTIPDGSLGDTPAVANGVVYVNTFGGDVYALNETTGHKLWDFAVSGKLFTAPAVANGVVYVRGGVPQPGIDNLYALNASTGAKLWSYAIGNYVGTPIVANGVVYVSNTDTTTTGVTQTDTSHLRAFSIGADLFLRVTPSATMVHQGDLLTYTFPVWNVGPVNADHEVLMTQAPPGTTFDYVRISGTPGLGTCTTPPYGGTGQIVCHENGSMAPNATWTVRLTVKVTAPSGTTITENAATMSDTPDPNLNNNTATVSVKVQ
ncbi:MAG TPA: PQQ-binding-like beta-propeller repeat protein [Alloacidobacterium sp.]|nr:PQQ-binding-like beta-propeller repeat protein [Alloacidobacterium sp.]